MTSDPNYVSTYLGATEAKAIINMTQIKIIASSLFDVKKVLVIKSINIFIINDNLIIIISINNILLLII